jgi:23S rRNA (adenine2030-N6)-methyltransferase
MTARHLLTRQAGDVICARRFLLRAAPGAELNYRHAFHAGNFADLVKHAALLQLIAAAQADAAPLVVIDTHAGRGLYDLTGPEAQRSGEAQAGIGRLMTAREAPVEFAPLIAAVKRLNPGGGVARYPGSPWLAIQALRSQDRYFGYELRPAEEAALRKALKGGPSAETRCADGFAEAARRCPASGRVLLLIDPPFERADDYAQAAAATASALERNAGAQVMIWLPLKDLETFDAFLRELEDAVHAPILVAETRMRPLADPLRMNGCALVLVGAEAGLAPHLEAVCHWTAAVLGEGGSARVYRLGNA